MSAGTFLFPIFWHSSMILCKNTSMWASTFSGHDEHQFVSRWVYGADQLRFSWDTLLRPQVDQVIPQNVFFGDLVICFGMIWRNCKLICTVNKDLLSNHDTTLLSLLGFQSFSYFFCTTVRACPIVVLIRSTVYNKFCWMVIQNVARYRSMSRWWCWHSVKSASSVRQRWMRRLWAAFVLAYCKCIFAGRHMTLNLFSCWPRIVAASRIIGSCIFTRSLPLVGDKPL